PRSTEAAAVRIAGYRIRFRMMLSAVERAREKPDGEPTASSSIAFVESGIAPRTGSSRRRATRTGPGAPFTGAVSTVARTSPKSSFNSPSKCFSPIGPGNAPTSLGRLTIAIGAAIALDTGAAGAALGGAAEAGAGLGAAAALGAAPLVSAAGGEAG